MRLKAIFPELRANEVESIPLAEFKEDLKDVEMVYWLNGHDCLYEASARSILRCLNAMPEGSEVVVITKSSRRKRAFATNTWLWTPGQGNLYVMTDYDY